VVASTPTPTAQLAELRGEIETLAGEGAIGRRRANVLLKKLDQAQSAIDRNSPPAARGAIGALKTEVRSLIAFRVLTRAEANPLLASSD